jgi:hypothetical protein
LLPPPKRWIKEIGRKYGWLTVVGFVGKLTPTHQRMITCRCTCGLYVDVMLGSLHAGLTMSCGCLRSVVVAARNAERAKHNAAVGGEITPLYRVWQQIKQRCCNVKNDSYTDYGGRGISLFPPWKEAFADFEAYIVSTIGEKPDRRHSLDRIDNEKGYVPGNLRWATPEEQNRNRRTIVLMHELAGERGTLSEWAAAVGVPYDLVRRRVYVYKWPLDEALGTMPGFGRCPAKERRKWNGRLRGDSKPAVR